MKKKILILILALFMFGFFGCEGDKDNPSLTEFDLDPAVVLHRKWPFPVGVAVPGAGTSNASGMGIHNNALNRDSNQHQFLPQFNVYVAENEMKPDQILPSSSITINSSTTWNNSGYRWANAEALADYAKNNGKKIRFHTLFWHDQTPSWFFTGGSGTSGRVTKEELYQRMEHHTRIVFEWIKEKQYQDTIVWFDVVNEAVSQDTAGARPPGNGSGQSMYTQIMRDSSNTNDYEWIIKAFEFAKKYADETGHTNAKFYLTDFGVERPFTRGGATKMADFKTLVNYLIENDAPIDGVGFQGHFRLYDHPVSTTSTTANDSNRVPIEPGIEEFAAIQRKDGTKLKVQICEMDISLFSNLHGEGNAKTIASNLLDIRLSDLADTYLEFFDMFERQFNAGNLDMVVIWGIADGHSWLNNHPETNRTDHPLLFNRNYKAKQAYMKLVEGRPDLP